MQYGSSYAVGAHGGQQGHAMPGASMGAARPDLVLPPPPPRRMHWSSLLFAGGIVVCLLGILVAVSGVPGRMGYDVSEEGRRNKPPDSMDPMAIQKSLDANMKWIDRNSSSEGGYLGYIESINRHEAAIPVMVQALAAMDASVRTIDGGLGVVTETTEEMRANMEAMAASSQASADTMAAMGEDLGFLSKTMVGLAASTTQLTTKMAAIEKKAAGISAKGTSAALATTKQLSGALPDGVPDPVFEGAAGGGGGAGTLDAYEAGEIQ